MSEHERASARDWFAKADTDFRSAQMLADISGPPETICFLAQQGAEKYLKGYLVSRGVIFRRVHDMLEILNGCRRVDKTFEQLEEDCRALNPYAVEVKYPGIETFYEAEDALDALERAGRIRRFVRKRLGLDAEKPDLSREEQ